MIRDWGALELFGLAKPAAPDGEDDEGGSGGGSGGGGGGDDGEQGFLDRLWGDVEPMIDMVQGIPGAAGDFIENPIDSTVGYVGGIVDGVQEDFNTTWENTEDMGMSTVQQYYVAIGDTIGQAIGVDRLANGLEGQTRDGTDLSMGARAYEATVGMTGVASTATGIGGVAKTAGKKMFKGAADDAVGEVSDTISGAARQVDETAEFNQEGGHWELPESGQLGDAGKAYNTMLQEFKKDGGRLDVDLQHFGWDARGNLVSGLMQWNYRTGKGRIQISKGGNFGTRMEELVHYFVQKKMVNELQFSPAEIEGLRHPIEKRVKDIVSAWGFRWIPN